MKMRKRSVGMCLAVVVLGVSVTVVLDSSSLEVSEKQDSTVIEKNDVLETDTNSEASEKKENTAVEKSDVWKADTKEKNNVQEIHAETLENAAENTTENAAGMLKADSLEIFSIVVINGNTGESRVLAKEDSAYHDLLKLYRELNFAADYEENTRVGYQYRMLLQDAEGNTLQSVTPYKDGVVADSIFFKYDTTGNDSSVSLRLMESLEYISHCKEEVSEKTANCMEENLMFSYEENGETYYK